MFVVWQFEASTQVESGKSRVARVAALWLLLLDLASENLREAVLTVSQTVKS